MTRQESCFIKKLRRKTNRPICVTKYSLFDYLRSPPMKPQQLMNAYLGNVMTFRASRHTSSLGPVFSSFSFYIIKHYILGRALSCSRIQWYCCSAPSESAPVKSTKSVCCCHIPRPGYLWAQCLVKAPVVRQASMTIHYSPSPKSSY